MSSSFSHKQAMAFLQKQIQIAAPSGAEENVQASWLSYIKPFTDKTYSDTYGTAVAVLNPKKKLKILLAAHADEISWQVNYISDDGLIYMKKNGGIDSTIASSKVGNIHTSKGDVKGVFGIVPIQLRKKENDTSAKENQVWLDVGATTKQAVLDLGIEVGNYCTYDANLQKLNNGYWAAKAFDNKIGGFIVAEVARKLSAQKAKLPFAVYYVNAVQEEIGYNGASMIVEAIEPDVALVIDVTHDTNIPGVETKEYGDIKCEHGPAIAIAPSTYAKLVTLIKQAAAENKIPFQLEACGDETGTDTEAFAFGNCGVASALISIPLKYMHSTVETLHEQDVENTILLCYNAILNLATKMDKLF